MATHREIKRIIIYPNGTCSLKMVVNFEKNIFEIKETFFTEFTEPQDIQNIYAGASALACQLLGQRTGITTTDK